MSSPFDIFSNSEAYDQDWKYEPLTFKEFVESPEHFNHPGLTQRQYDAFSSLVGNNPKKVFSSDRIPIKDKNIKTILWGKGCVVGDSEVVLESGQKIAIKEAAAAKYLSFSKLGAVFSDSTEVIPMGRKKCLTIKTLRGFSTTVSYFHNLYSTRNRHGKYSYPSWNEAIDLSVGDKVCVLNKTRSHNITCNFQSSELSFETLSDTIINKLTETSAVNQLRGILEEIGYSITKAGQGKVVFKTTILTQDKAEILVKLFSKIGVYAKVTVPTKSKKEGSKICN